MHIGEVPASSVKKLGGGHEIAAAQRFEQEEGALRIMNKGATFEQQSTASTITCMFTSNVSLGTDTLAPFKLCTE